MIEFKDREDMDRYVNASKPVGMKTDCKDAHDFGGADTVGLHVKRTGTDITKPCADRFGRYLGWLSDSVFADGFCVLVTNVNFSWRSVEVFETLEELKEIWELD